VGSYLAVSVQPQPSKGPRGLERLLELQDLDTAIDRLRARKELLEAASELREARAAATAAEDRVGQLRLEIDQLATHQRRLESDVDSLTQKMEAERTRLYDGSVANPKELQSIEHEVANLRGRIGRIEDEELELMERREGLDETLRGADQDAASAGEGVAEIERTSAADLVGVERDLSERTEARTALLPLFDEDLLDLYEDLRRSKKGVGAAALVDGVCLGCHQKISPMFLAGLRRTEPPWRCEYCRRIIVES
jgi:uncharacterized protein